MNTDRITIAVDGYSSCGKSTMAKALAKRIGYTYIDTGAMYRSVTLYAMRQGWIRDGEVDQTRLEAALPDLTVDFDPQGRCRLNGEVVEPEIRSMQVSSQVSRVSALPFVRRHLVRWQRAMGASGGVVMDGRDIGTVVFPDARLKVFVTADATVRAQRRYDELRSAGRQVSLEEVLANVRQRDDMDEHRADSPLRRADDALLLDNGHMTLEEQNEWMYQAYVKACRCK
ncbi:MAG: (d)CMP kinase [Paludibacteraceae bacterium]|nr:(d)CMP kinase [Paludibacteraceae bacterium]